jgi:hypothetical protein
MLLCWRRLSTAAKVSAGGKPFAFIICVIGEIRGLFLFFTRSSRLAAASPPEKRLKLLRTRWNVTSLSWMGARAVDWARLESVCTARYRGFESLPIRHTFRMQGQ